MIGEYLGDRMSLSWMRASLDSWPQVLLDDEAHFRAHVYNSFDLMTRVYYLLKQSNVERLENYLYSVLSYKSQWFYVLRTLHALEPALLRSFFAIGFDKDSSSAKTLFERTAPAAMSLDTKLSSGLIAISNAKGWTEPVAEESVRKELADSEDVGGSVHIQSLKPVNQSLAKDLDGLECTGSSTLKIVASNFTKWKLHIAAGNVLCALSHSRLPHYFYLCSFEDGKVNRHELRNGNPVRVHVQHGDVIAMDWGEQFVSFISEEFHCTDLSAEERFECIKSFCYAARNSTVSFIAIVENDGHGEPKGSEVKVEMGGEVKDEEQVGNVGEEELQES